MRDRRGGRWAGPTDEDEQATRAVDAARPASAALGQRRVSTVRPRALPAKQNPLQAPRAAGRRPPRPACVCPIRYGAQRRGDKAVPCMRACARARAIRAISASRSRRCGRHTWRVVGRRLRPGGGTYVLYMPLVHARRLWRVCVSLSQDPGGYAGRTRAHSHSYTYTYTGYVSALLRRHVAALTPPGRA